MRKRSLASLLFLLAPIGGCGDSATTSTSSSVTTGSSEATTSGAGTGGTTSTSSSTASTASSSSTVASSSSSSSSSTGGSGGGDPCANCVIIATTATNSQPTGIAVDANNVYWTNAGTGEVMQVKLDGTSPVTLQTKEVAPEDVKVLNGRVYWGSYAEEGFIRSTPIGGGAIADITSAPALRQLYVASDFIWWTNEPDDVQRVETAGLPDGGMPLLLSTNTLSQGITGDDLSIYWADRFTSAITKSDHDLANTVIIGTGDVPWGVAIDDTFIYWTESGADPGTGKVMRASKTDGSNPVTIATAQASPRGIAVDATNVYWVNHDDGTIYEAHNDGSGQPKKLAGGQLKPLALTIDADFVYWANTFGDQIVKVPK